MANVFDNSGGTVAVQRPNIFAPPVGHRQHGADRDSVLTATGVFAATATPPNGAQPHASTRWAIGRLAHLSSPAARILLTGAIGLVAALCASVLPPRGEHRPPQRSRLDARPSAERTVNHPRSSRPQRTVRGRSTATKSRRRSRGAARSRRKPAHSRRIPPQPTAPWSPQPTPRAPRVAPPPPARAPRGAAPARPAPVPAAAPPEFM